MNSINLTNVSPELVQSIKLSLFNEQLYKLVQSFKAKKENKRSFFNLLIENSEFTLGLGTGQLFVSIQNGECDYLEGFCGATFRLDLYLISLFLTKLFNTKEILKPSNFKEIQELCSRNNHSISQVYHVSNSFIFELIDNN